MLTEMCLGELGRWGGAVPASGLSVLGFPASCWGDSGASPGTAPASSLLCTRVPQAALILSTDWTTRGLALKSFLAAFFWANKGPADPDLGGRGWHTPPPAHLCKTEALLSLRGPSSAGRRESVGSLRPGLLPRAPALSPSPGTKLPATGHGRLGSPPALPLLSPKPPDSPLCPSSLQLRPAWAGPTAPLPQTRGRVPVLWCLPLTWQVHPGSLSSGLSLPAPSTQPPAPPPRVILVRLWVVKTAQRGLAAPPHFR